MHYLSWIFVFVLSMVIMSTLSCEKPPISPPSYWPTSGWRTSSPEAQGMDSKPLAEAVHMLLDKKHRVHSLLIIRNGFVVLDAYFYPFTPETPHDVASVTKSVTATLIGMAHAQGKIKSLSDKVVDYFPNQTLADPDKNAMAITDLLTMQSGLACVNKPTEETLFHMMASPNWVQFMLDLPMADKPGSKFIYNSGGVHLLSAILTQTSGKSALDFAQEYLFNPLGISQASWSYDPQNRYNQGWGDLRLTPHDMAKIGYLYLQNGMWENKPLLPPDWVSAATKKRVSFKGDAGYGYLWWIAGNPEGLFEARGRGGQRIVVWPEENVVLVITGGGFEPGVIVPYLVKSLKTNRPLPENSEHATLLKQALHRTTIEPAYDPKPVYLPATAHHISGKPFMLQSNAFGLSELSLAFQDSTEATLRLKLANHATTTPDAEYRVGLDGIPRTFQGRHDIPGMASGSWTSETTFETTVDEIGNINCFHIVLTFSDQTVSGTVEERTGLGKMSIAGTIKP